MRQVRTALAATLSAVALVVAAAAPAGASPAWKFNGSSSWSGSEEVLNHALQSSLTIPGMTTTCKPFVYVTEIENVGGTGQGSVSSVPLGNCTTNTVCTVDSIAATGLPWTATLTTVGMDHYLVISGVEFSILYGDPMCVLDGVWVDIHGSAGGRIDSLNESTVFDAASFSATGTGLLGFGSAAGWTGTFRMAAIGPRIGDSLSVG